VKGVETELGLIRRLVVFILLHRDVLGISCALLAAGGVICRREARRVRDQRRIRLEGELREIFADWADDDDGVSESKEGGEAYEIE
jgi:hypothetical protein